MAIEKSLVSGSMTMLILKLLSEKDMYGYEMIDTLRRKSQNVFELKAGTLYPLLHSLEEKGLLVVYEQEAGGKTRKYYSLTKQGRTLLEKKTEERVLSQAIAAVFGLNINLGDLGDKLLTVINALFAVLAILGVVVDPTTPGTGDSERALTYK